MARQRQQEPPPQETLPAPVNGRPRIRSSLVPEAGTPPAQWTANFDLTSPRGKAMLIAACNPADVVMGDQQQVRFRACQYLVYPDERLNRETGELEECGCMVLFDKDGKTFKTTSDFAPLSLSRILALYNEEEWRAGIPIIITSRKSRGGPGYYHDMRVELPPGDPAT